MLKVFQIEQSKEWDKIVKLFRFYDVYYLSGYVKSFRIHGDGEPLLFYFNDGKMKAINVVMRRDISGISYFTELIEKGKYFDFSTPYGYGGWLIEGDGDKRKVFSLYEQWCKEHGVICEFVRFHPVLENQSFLKEFYEILYLGDTVYIDLKSEEKIWSDITSKNRNVIRKAMKNEIIIQHGQYDEIYPVFREVYNQTMDKDKASSYYYFSPEFYQSILSDLPYNAEVFYAKNKEGIVISAAIIILANGFMHYHLSGSKKEYQHLAATNLLLYQAAVWGCNRGFSVFHLGGGVGSKKDSLYKFKKAFNKGRDLQFFIGKKIFDNDAYENLLMLRSRTDNTFDAEINFFPKYRG